MFVKDFSILWGFGPSVPSDWGMSGANCGYGRYQEDQMWVRNGDVLIHTQLLLQSSLYVPDCL